MAATGPPSREQRTIGLAAWSGTSTGMHAAHRHGDLELNYVLAGTMTYLIGGSLVTLPPHRLCALWGGAPHQALQPDEPVRLRWATVPLGSVLAWELPEALSRALLAEQIVIDPHARPGDEAMLEQWERDLHRPDEARRRIVLLEVEARLRRLGLDLAQQPTAENAGSAEAPARPPQTAPSLRAVQHMARYIAEQYQQQLSAEDIAQAAGLHPNYAMTLFRQHTGLTLNQYLTQQRIAHAQRMLATTQAPILDVAFDSGFGSVSRFFEAFKRSSGMSPRQFRLRLSQA